MRLKTFISIDDFKILRTWVDASYGVHMDMQGHTRAAISLRTGIIHYKSLKQHLNTKSSSETELIGASDYMPYNVWFKRFLLDQGYELQDNIYYQDNKSALWLERNGLRLSGEKFRHIHIRYYFSKDILVREKINLEHCKTKKMIADYFTKPLQGKLFKMIRDCIMGMAEKLKK